MKLYVPDIYIDSIKNINYESLKKRNIKWLLFDLDNTIIRYDSVILNNEIVELFNKLKKQFNIVIISNSFKKRVEKVNEGLNVETVSFALKPLPFKLKKLLNKNNIKKNEVAIIGDQLLTDIKVGKSVGILSILVEPIATKDLAFTKINRKIENYQFKKMEEKNLLKRGKYYE